MAQGSMGGYAPMCIYLYKEVEPICEIFIRGWHTKKYNVLFFSGCSSCCPCCFGVWYELFAFGCAFTLLFCGGSVF